MSESPESLVKSDDRLRLPEGENVLFAPILVFLSPTAAGRLLRSRGTYLCTLAVMVIQSGMIAVSTLLVASHKETLPSPFPYFEAVAILIEAFVVVQVLTLWVIGSCTIVVFLVHLFSYSHARIGNVFHGVVHSMLPATLLACCLILLIGISERNQQEILEDPGMRAAMEDIPLGNMPGWVILAPFLFILGIFWNSIVTGNLLRGLLDIKTDDIVPLAIANTSCLLISPMFGLCLISEFS